MQNCINNIKSIYSVIYIIFILFLWQNFNKANKESNEFIDPIDCGIIFFSYIQFLLLILRIIISYNMISAFISIIKFTQNCMICLLLLRYILSKHEDTIDNITNIFYVTIFIIDNIIFVLYALLYPPMEINTKEPLLYLFITLICFISDVIICFMTYTNKYNVEKMISIYENNKLKQLSNIKNDKNLKEELIIEENKIDNDNGFINTLYNENLKSIIIILNVYFYILLSFMISFLIDLLFYFYSRTNNIIDNNDNNIMNNSTYINNTFNNNENNNSKCIFYNDNYEEDDYKLLCLLFMVIRDIAPYTVIYIMLYLYKKKNYKRSSF